MESQPELSIGIPVFNGENFLEELLIALRNQTFNTFEIVICDNGSTDRTGQLCLDHAAKDPRIRYYRNERNLGANPNFNKVFALSRAPLFKWAAHDDLYEPTYLEKCVRILRENPDVVLAHSDCLCVDEWCRPFAQMATPSCYIDPRSGHTIRLDPPDAAEGRWVIQRFWEVLFRMGSNLHIFGVIRREALASTHLLRNFYGTDKLVLAELALLGPFAHVPERLFIKRYHKDMSWMLSLAEQRKWSESSGVIYSRRLRQLSAFMSAPFGKGLSVSSLVACLGIVLLLGPKVIITALSEERRRQTLIAPWRQGGPVPAREAKTSPTRLRERAIDDLPSL
jgi:glycosyltransferase involved in cell wall biosynthesis